MSFNHLTHCKRLCMASLALFILLFCFYLTGKSRWLFFFSFAVLNLSVPSSRTQRVVDFRDQLFDLDGCLGPTWLFGYPHSCLSILIFNWMSTSDKDARWISRVNVPFPLICNPPVPNNALCVVLYARSDEVFVSMQDYRQQMFDSCIS